MDKLALLASMSPDEFERYVADYVLPALGLKVLNVIGGSYDRGCDIIAENVHFGTRICVQVKKYHPNKKVPETDVRDVIYGMRHHRCERGLMVTTSDLSGPALDLAREEKNRRDKRRETNQAHRRAEDPPPGGHAEDVGAIEPNGSACF